VQLYSATRKNLISFLSGDNGQDYTVAITLSR